MISAYPAVNDAHVFTEEAAEMERIIELIKAIRNRRSEMNIAPSRKAALFIQTKYVDTFRPATHAFFARLASAADVSVAEQFDESIVSADTAVQVITPAATAYLPLADLIDFEKEKARLSAELSKMEGEVKRLEGKLGNQGFVAKAPAAVVEAERAKLASAKEKLAATQAALAKLS